MPTKVVEIPVGTLRRAVAVASVLLALCGCAHSVVYDEKRHTLAQETQKAVTAAHVFAAVAELEKAFTAVATSEETNAREEATEAFEEELRNVSRAPSVRSRFELDDESSADGLMTALENRLQALGTGTPTAALLTEIRTLNAQIRAQRDALDVLRVNFRAITTHAFASCADIYAASTTPEQLTDLLSPALLKRIPADRQATAVAEFKELVAGCQALDESAKSLAAVYSDAGVIPKLRDQVAQIDAAIVADAVAQAQAQQQLDAAVAEFKGVKASMQPDPSKLESLEARADGLLIQIQNIRETGGAAAEEVLAAEELKQLEAIIAALAGKTPEAPLSPDTQTAVAVARALPALRDEADTLLKDASKARLVPFLAAVDHQRLIVQSHEAVYHVKRTHAERVRQQLDAALAEGFALATALDPFVRHPSWSSRSIGELERTLSAEEKSTLHRALALYGDEVRQHRIDGAVYGAQALAVRYQQGYVQSKYSAAQWDGLMDTVAQVLVDYHAAGIKTADIAEFFKALGLFAIAIGVAQ